MVNELTVLTTIHVLAAALWVGSVFMLNVVMALAAHRGEPPVMLMAMRVAEFVGFRVLVPLAVITIASGVWLTADYYDFELLWIQLGMIGALTALAVGVLYLNPRAGRAVKAMEAGTPPPPGRNWVPIVGRLNLLLLLALVVIMVIKPT